MMFSTRQIFSPEKVIKTRVKLIGRAHTLAQGYKWTYPSLCMIAKVQRHPMRIF